MKSDVNPRSLKYQMFSIATPIMFNLLFFQLQIIIDRAFLGHVNSDFLSAIGNVSFPLWTSMSVIWALGTGTTILISQSLGAKNKLKAESYCASAFKYNSILSLILFLVWFIFSDVIFKLMGVVEPILSYSTRYVKIMSFGILTIGLVTSTNAVFQGSKITGPMMYTGFFRNTLNVILDYSLIFGHFGMPKLGLEGAAIATVIADFIGSFSLFVWMYLDKRLPIKIKFKKALFSPFKEYLNIIKIGIPASLEELLWNAGNLTLVRYLNMLNIVASGIYTLIYSIELIPALIFVSLGQAVSTMTGYKTGEGNKKEIKKIVNTGLISAFIVSITIAVIFLFFPKIILSIFSKDTDLINQSILFLFVSCFTFIPRSSNIIYGGGIRGQGNTKWMLYTQIFGTFFITSISYFFIFTLKFGILGLFIGMFTDELVRAFINGIKFYSSIKKENRFLRLDEILKKLEEPV
jgi:putative MATE family efflux protein